MKVHSSLIKYQEAKQSQTGDVVRVQLGGKTVGAIRAVEGGFAYFPKPYRQSQHGDTFKTVSEVKQSLESE